MKRKNSFQLPVHIFAEGFHHAELGGIVVVKGVHRNPEDNYDIYNRSYIKIKEWTET